MNRRTKRMIDKHQAAREGRRFHAFYRGCQDRRAGRGVNPYPPGSQDAACWDSGRKFTEAEQ